MYTFNFIQFSKPGQTLKIGQIELELKNDYGPCPEVLTVHRKGRPDLSKSQPE